ncbi:MAG: arylsulfatase [Acidobacteria bacterium]|nr:arylsulfatase [Acidobacteriota bacterium]
MSLLPTLLALASVSPAATPAAGERPNVVLIMTDDQGYGDLGAHGNPVIQTPRLDRLAAESVELAAFYVSPVCAPTRASLLTGRYHQRTGVMSVTSGYETMDADEVTLAEVLGAAGYRTALFGKWHLGEYYPWVPHAQGFDEYVGFRPGHLDDDYFDPVLEHNGQPLPTRGYITDILTDHAIRFVEDNRERPFFVYLPYNAPHTPLFVPERYARPYFDRGLPERTALVYGMIQSIDENVGRLLDRLDALDLARDTIVIFLSDNGPIWGWSEASPARYNAGLRAQKFTVFEGGIRVPFFIRWPGRLEPGLRLDEPAAHIDVLPTLLDYCGVDLPAGVEIDGVSLRRLLEGGPWPARTLFMQYALETTRDPAPHPGSVARTRRFKMVQGRDTAPWGRERPPVPNRLFDLLADRGEQNDLAMEVPERLAALDRQYTAWWQEVTARRGFARHAIEIGHPEENPVVLTPHHARASGNLQFLGFRGLRRERVGPHPTGVAGDWLSGWTELEQKAVWKVDVQRSGVYEVVLRLRCPASDAGSRVRVTVGETRIEGLVPEAPLPVGEWRSWTLGRGPLTRGEQPLTIRALSRPGDTVMELAAVELRWLGPSSL